VHLRSQIPIPCREDTKTTIFSIKDFTKAIAKSNLGDTAKGYLDAIDSAITKATLPAKSTRAILNDWFNEACRKAKRRRSKALSSLVKARKCLSETESRDFLDKFRLARSAARDTFRSAKIAYRKSLFEGLGEHVSGKAAWSAIRRCIGGRWTRRKTPQAPLTMQSTLANRLGHQFCSIRNSPDVTAFALPLEQELPGEVDPIEEWEVQEAIRKLRDKSAPGADGITVPMLKILFKCNPNRLTQTLNELLLDFDRYKHEIVRAIPKDGGDFRPIALLSQLGKLIERVISWRITRILRNQPQITERQFGCRTGNRVQDSATLLQHTAVQSGKKSVAVFLDARKAFDRLGHQKVIEKMQSLGIPESLYNWISYYLKGRTFQVRIGAELGSIHHAKGGTPQGSPLSVPLWHIFFSDIPEESQALLFMDDICLFGHNSATVQKRLDALSNWAATNHIDWNLEKCVVLPTKAGTVPMITLHGHELKVVESTRYLGILFSSSQSGIGFSFHAEAEKLRGIITSRANWLKLLSHAPLGVLASAYRSLVQSRICFTIPFLQDHLASVEKSQQQSLRIICKSLPGVPWARLYNATGIPPIESLFWSSWPGTSAHGPICQTTPPNGLHIDS
jgi:hypothetical protein